MILSQLLLVDCTVELLWDLREFSRIVPLRAKRNSGKADRRSRFIKVRGWIPIEIDYISVGGVRSASLSQRRAAVLNKLRTVLTGRQPEQHDK